MCRGSRIGLEGSVGVLSIMGWIASGYPIAFTESATTIVLVAVSAATPTWARAEQSVVQAQEGSPTTRPSVFSRRPSTILVMHCATDVGHASVPHVLASDAVAPSSAELRGTSLPVDAASGSFSVDLDHERAGCAVNRGSVGRIRRCPLDNGLDCERVSDCIHRERDDDRTRGGRCNNGPRGHELNTWARAGASCGARRLPIESRCSGDGRTRSS